MMKKHSTDLVAHLAAQLLAGRHDAEPHHVKNAVDAAHAILNEVHSREHDVPADESPSEDTSASTGKGKKHP